MTIFPVPASVPVLSIRARFIFVPGSSDGYQDRICFTRSVRRIGFSGSSGSSVGPVLHALAGGCHASASPRGTPVQQSGWPADRRGPDSTSVMLMLLAVRGRSDEARPGLGVADPAA